MSVLSFLIPVLGAAESRNKLKKYKTKEEVRKEIQKSSDSIAKLCNYCVENYTDMNLELDTEPISDEEILELSKRLPSYDQTREWSVLTKDRYYFNTNDFQKRFALAKYGKIRRLDASALGNYTIHSERGIFWGRERYDYRGQIYHEMMVEWAELLKENGFPYDLYVYNKYDGELIKDSKPANCCSYKFGNKYVWSSAVNR